LAEGSIKLEISNREKKKYLFALSNKQTTKQASQYFGVALLLKVSRKIIEIKIIIIVIV